MMEFDYSRLRGRIRECFGTEAAFAAEMHMGRVSLSQRLNNILEFSAPEMLSACNLLNIPTVEIPAYFFTLKVQKGEPCGNDDAGETS